MLQAVIYYIVTVILTKELVIATDQCTVYQFKSPFFPGVSCEDIYNKNPESHEWSGYYWITDGPSRVYCGMTYPGSSCENIYNNNVQTGDKPGYYHINNNQWTYCDMTVISNGTFVSTCAGVGGGWRRIVNINISAGDDCPGEWRKATQSGVSFCRVPNDNDQYTCSSASFSTNGISYQRVCGRARGYQKGWTLGLFLDQSVGGTTIDGSYVGGLSITYGGSPRKHIWTYATGNSETARNLGNCPCATVHPGKNSSWYIGDNYYCESGSVGTPGYSVYYLNDTLWDDVGCMTSTCCDCTTQPWFQRQLNQTTQDDIEARICVWGPFNRGSTLIDQLELFIQ